MTALVYLFVACEQPNCNSGERSVGEGLCAEDTAGSDTEDSGLDTTDTGATDTGDTADANDSADTHDSADTADSGIAPFSLEQFDVSAHISATDLWYGLSVAPNGVVWAATSIGLLALDPASGSARMYGIADGLLFSSARSVLAHSDGTLWVGYYGTVSQQGDHFAVAGDAAGSDGTLSRLEIIDFTESTEILQIHRMREQPFGAGVGDVWMGTNEGLCLYDLDRSVFAEHAHPTHPHSLSYGVAITDDDHIWNGDEYQISRWNYSDDGDLSPSADLLEFWSPWPVTLGVDQIDVADADAVGEQVWFASTLFGVARVDVGASTGTSGTALYAEPTTALAVRAVDSRTVFVGTDAGLWVLDIATDDIVSLAGTAPFDQPISQLARDISGSADAMWMAVPAGLLRVTGLPPTP